MNYLLLATVWFNKSTTVDNWQEMSCGSTILVYLKKTEYFNIQHLMTKKDKYETLLGKQNYTQTHNFSTEN